MNIAMDVTQDFVVRLAAAKVMSRPPLGSVSPWRLDQHHGHVVDPTGNPLLKP